MSLPCQAAWPSPLCREAWPPPARPLLGIPSCFADGETEAQSWIVTQTPGEHWLLGVRVGTHGATIASWVIMVRGELSIPGVCMGWGLL